MASLSAVAARGAYGAAFSALLPALLVFWARAAPVDLPVPHLPGAGLLIAAAGAGLMAAGWLALWIDGGGLPMNAFPPERLASRGPYALCAHPIYVGFCTAAAGVALATGSAAGLWLVTPAIGLACAALVLGHEAPSLRSRFGAGVPAPILALPPASHSLARPRDRLAVALLIGVPWTVLYGAVVLLGPASDAVATWLPLERSLPVMEEAELIYGSTYLFVLLALLAPRSRADARRLAVRGSLAIALVFPLYFLLPLAAPPKPFVPHGPLGELLAAERALDTPGGAFPSFHVVWALLAADAWAQRTRFAGRIARAWAYLIAASCVLTGMHSLLDVLAAFGAYALIVRARLFWEGVRGLAERTANRWREWRIGPVRLLEYGAWAALANLIGVSLVSAMIGPGHVTLVMITAAAGIGGALLAGQVLDRPRPEARPFGFYGGLLGIVLAAAMAPLCGTPREDTWLLLSGYCAAGPFVQALGRVRCLIQGCCHGRMADDAVGILCRSPLSRVTKAGLAGVPIHPTPLYSILWNLLVGAAGLRFWSLGVSATFLCGVYLMLSGLGRFVEESYRGEPDTLVIGGLRIYQWFAAGTLIAGAALTAQPGVPLPEPHLDGASFLVATIFAAFTWFAYGVDFPDKKFRFARLA
jgi:protein-S-isoprenylcysteine O-methyltransferase Ste14